MSRKTLVPIAALVALVAKNYSGADFTQVELDIIVEGALAIVALIGIFMNPKR